MGLFTSFCDRSDASGAKFLQFDIFKKGLKYSLKGTATLMISMFYQKELYKP